MRKKSLVLLPVLVAVAATLALAGPAQADTSGGTPVTVEINGGPLNISVPTATVDLGAVSVSTSPQTVSALLGTVTVTDTRGGTLGWTAAVTATDFTGPQNVSVSAVGESSYTTPNASVIGTSNVAASDLAALYPGGAVQTATGVLGANAATWDPTLSVTLPADAQAGTYSSTVTHSVS
jgi:hypothetical protein